MGIESKIADARDRQELSQEQLAFNLKYDRTTITKWESGERKIPYDVHKKIASVIDDEQFYFESWGEMTGYVSIPFFNGKDIEQRSVNMKHLVQLKTNEAMERLEKPCWYKPIDSQSREEKEEMKNVIRELLDASASMVNLVAMICKEYNFSMRDLFREWRGTLKARRMEK